MRRICQRGAAGHFSFGWGWGSDLWSRIYLPGPPGGGFPLSGVTSVPPRGEGWGDDATRTVRGLLDSRGHLAKESPVRALLVDPYCLAKHGPSVRVSGRVAGGNPLAKDAPSRGTFLAC